jgi:hypothetical protein
VLGNFNTRNWYVTTRNLTYDMNATWEWSDHFKLKFGGQYRQSAFKNRVLGVAPANQVTTALPAGVTTSDFTYQITGLNTLLAPGALSALPPLTLKNGSRRWATTISPSAAWNAAMVRRKCARMNWAPS